MTFARPRDVRDVFRSLTGFRQAGLRMSPQHEVLPRPYGLPEYIVCTVFALIVIYLLGKDMAWDTLSYHI